MREFLIFSPFNFVFRSFIMIIVMSLGSVLKSLCIIDFLSLREPGSSGLSPSMIELKEHVVKMFILMPCYFHLVEMRRDIT